MTAHARRLDNSLDPYLARRLRTGTGTGLSPRRAATKASNILEIENICRDSNWPINGFYSLDVRQQQKSAEHLEATIRLSCANNYTRNRHGHEVQYLGQLIWGKDSGLGDHIPKAPPLFHRPLR